MNRILVLVLLAAFAVSGASCHKHDKGTKPAAKTEKKVKAPRTHKAKTEKRVTHAEHHKA